MFFLCAVTNCSGFFVVLSIDSVNKLVVALGFAKAADFTGLALDKVNTIIQILADYFAEFTSLRPLGFIGNGLIRNPGFIKKDPTVLAWVEGIEYKGASVSAEALCFVRFDDVDTEFLIAHELCHVLDSNFGMAISSDFGDAELLADLWAEYRTSQNPSKSAIDVGKYIEKYYQK